MGAPWEKYQTESVSPEPPWKKYASSEIPGPRSLIEQIPVEPGANTTPTPQRDYSVLDRLKGGVEAGASMVTGALALPVAAIAGIAASRGRKHLSETEPTVSAVRNALTYRPREEAGREMLGDIGNFLQHYKLDVAAPGAMTAPTLPMGSALSTAVRNEGNLAATLPKQMMQQRAEQTTLKKSAESWARAPQIDAAQAAQRRGIALNPANSNPTGGNITRSTLAGNDELNKGLSRKNEHVWADIAREDMGLPSNTPLNKQAFESAVETAAKGYEPVRQLGPMTDTTGDIIGGLESLRLPDLIGGKDKAAAVSRQIDDAVLKVEQGMTGASILDEVRQLRRDAQATYSSQKRGIAPSPEDIAKADANMGIANLLESLIEQNAPADVLAGYRSTRAKIAQIKDYERATDITTGKVDPAVIAKMAQEGRPLSGGLADIAQIAGNYPEIAQIGVEQTKGYRRFSRAGMAGTIGFGLGMATGVGALAGGATGAALGHIMSRRQLSKVASPEYQAKRAIPEDFRIRAPEPAPPSQMTPRTGNEVVPYDWSQNVMTAAEYEAARARTPNWTTSSRSPDVGPAEMPEFGTSVPGGPRALPAPNAEATMAALRAEDVRRANISRQVGQAQDAAQAALEAARPRASAGAGQLFTIDPTTNRLVMADQGVKGATPDTILNLGRSLETASEKIASGQSFAMSAAEKVAWDRTKADLAQIDLQFKKLSNAEIAQKMSNRQWVSDTVTRIRGQIEAMARQEAMLLEQMSNRNNLRTMGQEMTKKQASLNKIAADRQRLVELAEILDGRLRIVKQPKTGQGPKTLEAKRNALSPQNQNALRNER